MLVRFKFQDNVERKPVSQEFSQPFMYIEKVIKKEKIDDKLKKIDKYEPFITTVNPKRKGKGNQVRS